MDTMCGAHGFLVANYHFCVTHLNVVKPSLSYHPLNKWNVSPEKCYMVMQVTEMILGRGIAPIPPFLKVLALFLKVSAPHAPFYHYYFIIYHYYVASFDMGCGFFWGFLGAMWPHFLESSLLSWVMYLSWSMILSSLLKYSQKCAPAASACSHFSWYFNNVIITMGDLYSAASLLSSGALHGGWKRISTIQVQCTEIIS